MQAIGGSGPIGITGEVRMWGGTIATIPNGWLHCNGAAVSRTTYAALFNIIGTQYGAGDGSTTFNLPDTRNYFPVGANADDGGAAKATAHHAATAAKTRSNNNVLSWTDTGQTPGGSNDIIDLRFNGTFTGVDVDLPSYPNFIAFAFMIKT